MDTSLRNAANAAASATSSTPSHDLTITCAWEDVLANGLTFNYPLLKLLCRAHALGHTVIVTSTSAEETMEDMLALAIEFGRDEHHDLDALSKIRFISKNDLMHLSATGQIRVDIAIDSETIADQTHLVRLGETFQRQRLNYANPQLEVHVHSNFSTTPSMDNLRNLIYAPYTRASVFNQPREPH